MFIGYPPIDFDIRYQFDNKETITRMVDSEHMFLFLNCRCACHMPNLHRTLHYILHNYYVVTSNFS